MPHTPMACASSDSHYSPNTPWLHPRITSMPSTPRPSRPGRRSNFVAEKETEEESKREAVECAEEAKTKQGGGLPFVANPAQRPRTLDGVLVHKEEREAGAGPSVPAAMEWRKSYLDVTLVPLGLLLTVGYHAWLWHRVRSRPRTTIIATNAAGRRLWVFAIMKDIEKKNILAVQTLRNAIMGSTLMATTSILLCSGLAALISSTYSVKKPLNDALYGAHGEVMVALKYVTLLVIFIFSFVCHSLSIRFINQVNFLINTPQAGDAAFAAGYVADLLEKGVLLNTVGNRLFYAALPLVLWIFGPVLVFLCSLSMIPVLYNLDIVHAPDKGTAAIGAGSPERGEEFDV